MANYAQLNIPNYNTITSIPEEHSPNSINTSLVQDWHNAFYNCENLNSLPNSFYNTSNAINMSDIFRNCKSLTTVPNFDTSNVTNMTRMFTFCYNLTTIPNFDTSNVTNMGAMFSSCSNLTTVPNFDTSNVSDMSFMFGGLFHGCRNLTTVPNFDTSNVINMGYMFAQCYNLTTVPNFDTSNVINMHQMFFNCRNLANFPIINISSKVNIIYQMFYNCPNICGNLYIEGNQFSMYQLEHLLDYSNNYVKNIYCHDNSNTYNWLLDIFSSRNFYSNWNTYLKTMENDYAEIPWTGNGIYRFPTNKIAIISQYVPGSNNLVKVIEVSPYTDYELLESSGVSVDIIYSNYSEKLWATTSTPQNAVFPNSTVFRFFKDITNMTPDIVDTI